MSQRKKTKLHAESYTRQNRGRNNQNVPFSSDSSYDSIAYNLVKTRLLESEAEMEG